MRTDQAGGEGGVRLAEVERTHADQVGDLGGGRPRWLGAGGQQEVLPCTDAQTGSRL